MLTEAVAGLVIKAKDLIDKRFIELLMVAGTGVHHGEIPRLFFFDGFYSIHNIIAIRLDSVNKLCGRKWSRASDLYTRWTKRIQDILRKSLGDYDDIQRMKCGSLTGTNEQ